MREFQLPPAQGLYDPAFEKDGCGIGLVADLAGKASRSIVQDSLELLKNLKHRGAQGRDADTGDGAGILCQIPDEFFRRGSKALGFELPPAGRYGVAQVFMPDGAEAQALGRLVFQKETEAEGLRFLGWRRVPTKPSTLGSLARESSPAFLQGFVALPDAAAETPTDSEVLAFERRLFSLRRKVEKKLLSSSGSFYFPSFSARTLVYKGLLLPEQLETFYPDLVDPSFKSAVALVHSRFSTNTFPTWHLAHPFRTLCHNGEINTLRGNLNWMRARESRLESPLWPKIGELLPILQKGQSDSASLDEVAEFLSLSGRSLPQTMMMLIPEPYSAQIDHEDSLRAFYEYHAHRMEPWDGPAAVGFTDGWVAGATLDRNGLRPCRFVETKDGRLILASESGALQIPPRDILRKGRLEPGKMLIINLRSPAGMIKDAKSEIAAAKPYRKWMKEHSKSLNSLLEATASTVTLPIEGENLRIRQRRFGYTEEELRMTIAPMANGGEEALSSMGADIPLAILSKRGLPLFRYFKQHFAQVTNPPIDPIREALVMSLDVFLGPEPNLLGERPEDCARVRLESPILNERQMSFLRSGEVGLVSRVRTEVLTADFSAKPPQTSSEKVGEKPVEKVLAKGVEELCLRAELAARSGASILILSDREMEEGRAPIPSMLAVSSVHHHLMRVGVRSMVSLVVESGEPRDVHHMACLLGYGASAIHPYLLLESARDLAGGVDSASLKVEKALDKGLLKILSKMGISTLQSYTGAQIFEAVGLSSEVVSQYFVGTPSRIGGIGLREMAEDVISRWSLATNDEPLEWGGEIHYRVQGESHSWNPESLVKLQQAAKLNDAKTYREFTKLANEETGTLFSLRGLLEIAPSQTPVDLSEVESAAQIVKRFTTGAMSLGAISPEAHETLAIAMNRMGAKSNSGEGGEDQARYKPDANGDLRSSAIKQVASARFGVTAHYLVNARELQIKMAQGAKPGEGGQLPGHKVDAYIAKLRHSTPGVGLISPPPHHDIYSIEDLKQLIFDLKNVNPDAAISVKLVSEAGVGTIAAGVAKAYADKILISGDAGGTGASPLSSIRYAGLPWELGLAEAHQTLVLNGLRDRVRLETDGQMKTGRDVVIAALLGADEFGFATAPLVVEGCLMMRKCHLNTCPVGIATQDPELRKKFTGTPEAVVNYFFFVAEEVRSILASLGLTRLSDAIGHVERLRPRAVDKTSRASLLDLSKILYQAHPPKPLEADPRQVAGERRVRGNPELIGILDDELITHAEPLLPSASPAQPIRLHLAINTRQRSVGAKFSGKVALKYGAKGLEAGTVNVSFTGSAGQSFGAFLVPGVRFDLEGEANDYVGKGLSGGTVAVFPPPELRGSAEDSVIVGNTALYGATSGLAFFSGKAGERFAVRNSGATAVVEGIGDHGCEYMTGGTIVVLGPTGRNFAAGMSGGEAFILDEDGKFPSRCNRGMVELETAVDLEKIHHLVKLHHERTGSAKAGKILQFWNLFGPKFIRVMPTEYRRALHEQAARPKDKAEVVAIV